MSSRAYRRRHVRRRRAGALLALVAVLAALWLAVSVAFPGVDTHGARVVHFTIDSALVHRTLIEAAVIPPGELGAGVRCWCSCTARARTRTPT